MTTTAAIIAKLNDFAPRAGHGPLTDYQSQGIVNVADGGGTWPCSEREAEELYWYFGAIAYDYDYTGLTDAGEVLAKLHDVPNAVADDDFGIACDDALAAAEARS